MVDQIGTDIKGHRTSPAEEREHDIALMAKRATDIPNNLQVKIEYNGNKDPLYVGFGIKGLATNQDGWLIYFLEYDVDNDLTSKTVAYDNWDNRASATYE